MGRREHDIYEHAVHAVIAQAARRSRESGGSAGLVRTQE